MTRPVAPNVFFDITIGGEPVGRIVMELFYDIVPKTTANFRSLCAHDEGPKMGFRKCRFHRIVPGVMCQGGDFTNNSGIGGKSIYGYRFEDENFAIKHDAPGILSMANGGKNKNGSQFFITAQAMDWLDDHHVAFGKVIEGYDEVVVKMLEQGQINGRTKKEVLIAHCGEVLTPEEQVEKDERDRLAAEKRAAEEEAMRIRMAARKAARDAEMAAKERAQLAREEAERQAKKGKKKK